MITERLSQNHWSIIGRFLNKIKTSDFITSTFWTNKYCRFILMYFPGFSKYKSTFLALIITTTNCCFRFLCNISSFANWTNQFFPTPKVSYITRIIESMTIFTIVRHRCSLFSHSEFEMFSLYKNFTFLEVIGNWKIKNQVIIYQI